MTLTDCITTLIADFCILSGITVAFMLIMTPAIRRRRRAEAERLSRLEKN